MAAVFRHGRTMAEARATSVLRAEAPEIAREFGALPRIRPARAGVRPAWGIKKSGTDHRSWKGRRAHQWR
jgi:hypothetical protein